jgi:hypothetical protein
VIGAFVLLVVIDLFGGCAALGWGPPETAARRSARVARRGSPGRAHEKFKRMALHGRLQHADPGELVPAARGDGRAGVPARLGLDAAT